jgi:hypothetical protein
MSATLVDLTKKIKPEPSAEQAAAQELVRRAREACMIDRPMGRRWKPSSDHGSHRRRREAPPELDRGGLVPRASRS